MKRGEKGEGERKSSWLSGLARGGGRPKGRKESTIFLCFFLERVGRFEEGGAVGFFFFFEVSLISRKEEKVSWLEGVRRRQQKRKGD